MEQVLRLPVCYFNSLAQQLFGCYSLREHFLSLSLEKFKTYFKIPSTESLLCRFKILFATMQDKNEIDASDVLTQIKDYEGKSLSLHEQKDVFEFICLLADKFEEEYNNVKIVNEFNLLFGICMRNEITCSICKNVKEYDEKTLTLPIDIMSMSSMEDSLKSFFRVDTLENDNAYLCQTCNRKTTAFKRIHLTTLPKYLMVILKRFEYDYTTMTRKKLNSKFEYPMAIDMRAYGCTGGEYELQGVIVHIGSAQGGHYISLVRQENKWTKFDDNKCTVYDINKLGQDTYGGFVIGSKNKENLQNAYMLVYAKKEQTANTLLKESYDEIIEQIYKCKLQDCLSVIPANQ